MTAGQSTGSAANHWNRWQNERDRNPTQYVDWGEHPTIAARIQAELFGSPTRNVFDFLKETYPEFSRCQVLSLCAGDGSFERLLLSQGVFGSITGMDIAADRVAAANDRLAEHEGRLQFVVGDVNNGAFGTAQYDVVFAKAALHHVENLEAVFAGIRQCLKPGGRLVTIDFFGPTRFQWTDAQLAEVNQFIDTHVPEELLRRADGSVHRNVSRPTIAAMIAMDPSEAVRSGDLHDLITQNFSQVMEFQVGGTLLNLIFAETIVNNFDPENPQHCSIMHAAFDLERKLMTEGRIGSDFRFVVAQR